jgi:para-aminobenzoate synthetase/4-amino-4-deoxychorismate lyase
VTADSVPMLEWRECGHKSAPLLAALGAPPVSPALVEPTADQLAGGLLETVQVRRGRPVRLGDHLARLHRSARELYGAPAPADLAERVRVVAATSTSVRAVLRIVLRPPGVELSVADLPDRASAPGRLRTVVRASGGMWRHKWADRQALTADEAGGDLPLYVADDGTVLETSRGNVFLLGPAGEVVTAPLRDDLLPGVTRAAVLDLARDAGRRLDLRCFGSAELLASPAFWTSSLSGAVPIVSVDGVALPRADADVAALAGDLGGASVFC